MFPRIVFLIVLIPQCGFPQIETIDHRRLVDSAYIVGELNAFLGKISADTADENSIMNLHGAHGSDESYYSIFGEDGPYKGLGGAFSPFNPLCEVPPRILRDSVFVAYLTENEQLAPRVSTYVLVGFLYVKVNRGR